MENIEIDSSSDIDDDILNNLELQYYPEPYKSLGSFILSAIVGIMSSYILNNQNLDKITDLYYKYCKNTENDNYIDEIIRRIGLENNLDKIEKLLNESKKLTNTYTDILKNNDYKNLELEKLNLKLIEDTLKIMKYNHIIKLTI